MTDSLQVGLPADAAATASALGLWVVLDGKLAANQLGHIVHRAAPYQRKRDAVHQHSDPRVDLKFANVSVSVVSRQHNMLLPYHAICHTQLTSRLVQSRR